MITVHCDTCPNTELISTVRDPAELMVQRETVRNLPAGWMQLHNSGDNRYRVACRSCTRVWSNDLQGYQRLVDARANAMAISHAAINDCDGCAKVARHPGEGYECARHPSPALAAVVRDATRSHCYCHDKVAHVTDPRLCGRCGGLL